MAQIMKETTINVRVTGMPVLRVRLWLGTQLLKLARAVIGCMMDVTFGPRPVTYDKDGIPQRYSIDMQGYDHELAQRLAVFLDGVEQDKVVAYDVEAGMIERFSPTFEHETLRGSVEVRWKTA